MYAYAHKERGTSKPTKSVSRRLHVRLCESRANTQQIDKNKLKI